MGPIWYILFPNPLSLASLKVKYLFSLTCVFVNNWGSNNIILKLDET